MKGPLIAIVPRVEGHPADCIVGGARVGRCQRCIAAVWVSPSTDARHPDELVCMECSGVPEQAQLERPTTAQLRETEAITGRPWTAEELMAAWARFAARPRA